jgi:DNA-directed RNA polymerase specialized sigma24 family protein
MAVADAGIVVHTPALVGVLVWLARARGRRLSVALQQGEPLPDAAFEGLLTEAYTTWMKPWALRQGLVMPGEDVEDVVQRVALKAWEKRYTYRPSNFRAWLSRIMTNLLIDQKRRARVLTMLPGGDATEMDAVAASVGRYQPQDVEKQVTVRLELDAALSAFVRRGGRHEKADELKLLAVALQSLGLNSAEIAERLSRLGAEKTRSAVTSLIFRAHDTMRRWRRETAWATC